MLSKRTNTENYYSKLYSANKRNIAWEALKKNQTKFKKILDCVALITILNRNSKISN